MEVVWVSSCSKFFQKLSLLLTTVSFWTTCKGWELKVRYNGCYLRTWGEGRKKSGCKPLGYGVPQGSTLFFNIYMKPLENIICLCGMMCVQYVDGTYLYPGTIGRCSESHNLVSGVWIRENRFRHNPKNVEWLLMQRTIDFSSVPSMVLDGVVLLGKSRLASGGPLGLIGPGELL